MSALGDFTNKRGAKIIRGDRNELERTTSPYYLLFFLTVVTSDGSGDNKLIIHSIKLTIHRVQFL